VLSRTSGADLKPEQESEFALSGILTNLSPVLQQHNIRRISPPLAPPDLESGGEMQKLG
jgi:hypothetical protein